MIYFCTEAYLKANTSITLNVDVNDILPLVKTSADMWVRSILGTYFYKDLLVKYNAASLSADESSMVAEMQPAIAWRAAADATIELSYQLKNKGIQTQSGDYSASPEYKAIMFNAHNKSDKAAFYENRLSEFLKTNKALYPEFNDILNNDSTVKDSPCNGGEFTSNIFFI